jgi:predicted nuclease of predicted toxin-antitoxin system
VVARFLADENFNQRIVRGLLRRDPSIAAVIAQAVGLGGASDVDMLEWAAANSRVILTLDVRTLVPEAHARVAGGLPMPGVIVAADDIPIGPAIDDILLIHLTMADAELEGQVIYLPL